jgi:hypothetical protein
MDAWEALLSTWAEDDRLPCYHLTEKYSTDVLVHLHKNSRPFLWEYRFFVCFKSEPEVCPPRNKQYVTYPEEAS